MEISPEIISLIQSGGTPALVICVYFIYRLESRLARIEKVIDTFLQKVLPDLGK